MLKAFSAVIFDMDGLVLDSEITYIAAWQQALQQLGCPLHAEFAQHVCGLAYPAIEQILLQTYGTDFDLQQFACLSAQNWRQIVTRQGIAVKAGVHDVLCWLAKQQIPYCLATNSPRNKALDCLALAGLQRAFPLIISREQVAQPKPQPDIFLHAAACLHVPITACLVLEDSYTGVLAGSRAGAQVIYIPSNTNNEASALAHREYPDLLQFLQNIQHELNTV